MANKIKPISKNKIVDYSDVEVKNFWLKKETYDVSEDLDYNSKVIQLLSNSKEGVICIQSESLTDTKVVKALFDAAQYGNRVYLLVNNYSQELESLKGKCLIRFGLDNIGSFALVNPNTNDSTGLLFTGQFTEQGFLLRQNLLVELDKEQNEVLFRHFCYHFWNTAIREVIDNNALDVTGSPNDIFPCKDNFCDSHFLLNTLNNISEKTTIAISSISLNPGFSFNNFNESTFITSLSGNNNDLIINLKKRGNEILACIDGIFINVICSQDDYWIIPKSSLTTTDILYALKLNARQKSLIDKVISNLKSNVDYEFISVSKRKALQNRTILKLGDTTDQEYQIRPKVTVNLGDILLTELLSYSEIEMYEPNFNDTGIAASIEFTWVNNPFTLPEKCIEHPLYEDWVTEESKIQKTLSIIGSKVKEAEDNESKLSNSLKRFFLGKKHLFERIKDELGKMKTEEFSKLSLEKLKEKISRINEIHLQVDCEVKAINQEDRKAKIDESIAELRDKISTKEIELKEKQKSLEAKEILKNKKLEEFCQKYKFKKEDLNKIINEWRQLAGNKNKHKNPKEASESEAKLIEYSEIQNVVFIQKIESEISTIEKDIVSLQVEVKRKESNKSKDLNQSSGNSSLDEFVGGKLTSANNDSGNKTELAIPLLQQLPIYGKLFYQNNQSYLAIEFWEEYDIGVKESERLKAKLCSIKY